MNPSLEYFAGLIDGEGHIGCQIYSGFKRPVIQLQMTCKKTVEIFANRFGMILRELVSPSRIKDQVERGHKKLWHCRCECHKAYIVIKQLRPYLITKAEAADEALAYYEGRICKRCNRDIPVERAKSAVFCSKECRVLYNTENRKSKEKAETHIPAYPIT